MSHASTATVDSRSRRRRVQQRPRRPIRTWLVLAGAAVLLVAGLVGLLDALLVLPLTAAVLAFATRAGRPVDRGGRTVPLLVVMLVGYLAVAGALALLPYLRVSPAVTTPVLAALQVVAMLVIAAPLAMPVLDDSAHRAVFPAGRRDLMAAAAGLFTLTVAHAGGVTYLLLAVVAVALPVLLAASLRLRGERPARRRQLVQAATVLVFAALLVLAALAGTFDGLGVSGPVGTTTVRVTVIVLAVVAAVLGFVPARRVPAATNALALATAGFLAVQVVGAYATPSRMVTLSAPFAGDWYVAQGGHAELVNNHRVAPPQRDALDLLEVNRGDTRDPGRTGLDSYYAFGEPLLAPADGKVVYVSDVLADRPAGSPDPDPEHAAGNLLILDIGNGKYVALAHLQRHSAVVIVGQEVRDGQALARVGNSGNSDEPHLHVQVQDSPRTDIHRPGVHTYPIRFRDVVLLRAGDQSRPTTADLRRGDYFRATTR
jgi:hypothetical protein